MDNIISTDNANICRALSKEPSFVSEELFVTESNGHKFQPGNECELVGLQNFPEYNGSKCTITAIRENGECGKAYYVKGEINKYMNWIYEYRLQKAV